jgi:alcohol dehydrogenase
VPGPGAIGRVRATGPDATRLRPGDWIYCDPTVRSRDNALSPDIALQGLTAGSEGGLRLQRYFHDGAWAEQMRVPTENAVPIGDIDEKDASRWCALGTLLVPFGGFLAAQLQAGEIALVNGATGSFGSAAVAVALGMGAQCVVATGRNEQALAELTRRFGARVRAVPMRGHEVDDRACILQAAPGPIDCVLDILPPAANAAQVRTAIMAVRPYGRVVLMGGVGMLGGAGLDLPTACGRADDRPDPRRPDRSGSIRGHRVRSGPRQRGGGECRRPERPVQNDRDPAAIGRPSGPMAVKR